MIICPSATQCIGLIDDVCPSSANPAKYFTEIIVNGNIVIPPNKPSQSNILEVTHQIMLRDVETVPVVLPGSSLPDGYKIVVSGTITLYIQYVADNPDQKVHSVHYELPFNAIIMRDCNYYTRVSLIPPDDPIIPNNYIPHVCVEKLKVTQIDSRTFSKEIVLMVWVEQNI